MNTNPPQILREKFLKALTRFYKKEILLLKYKVAERALTHKLAEHLQMEFPDYNVDCEYNKIGNGDPKRVGLLISEVQKKKKKSCCGNCDMCRRNKCVVFPDIIVHKGGRDENLIVVEAKTAWSKRARKRILKN